jgi:hypothetical protein
MSEKPVSEWDKLILDLGDANAKVAAFERSNAERKDKLDAASDVISAQAKTISALREALARIPEHRAHLDSCIRYRKGLLFTRPEECDCGLDAALRQTAKEK